MLQRAPNDRPLRVLVATPSGGRGQGGVDRIMATLRDEVSHNADVEADFLATRGSGHVAFSFLHTFAFCLRMAIEKARGRVDVVHINLASNGSSYRKMIIAGVAKLLGIPYVLHLHGAGYREFWDRVSPLVSRCLTNMFGGAAHVVVLGRVWREFVVGRVPALAGRISIIPNATAIPSRPHVGGGGSVHILFLGQIGDRKGVPQLGEALARMKELSGWRATIAGDGAVNVARARAVELGLADRVDIPGWVGPEQVADLLSEADVLVLPSFAENLPVSVIEGMASGLALVTTPVGAVPDIVTDEESGLLVPPGDVDALTDALTRLVLDRALRERLGAAAMAVHRARLNVPYFSAAVIDVWRTAAGRHAMPVTVPEDVR